jgi:hypothetical protein
MPRYQSTRQEKNIGSTGPRFRFFFPGLDTAVLRLLLSFIGIDRIVQLVCHLLPASNVTGVEEGAVAIDSDSVLQLRSLWDGVNLNVPTRSNDAI